MITQYNDAKLMEKAKRAGVMSFVLKENLMDVERIIHGIKG
jgi:AmiR/NasT family two-component response regulator